MSVDEHLPFLLRRQNVARYEDGEVVILDRRKFPFERSFVRCGDLECVARAIEQMVTQGGGPWVAALYALAMEARRVEGRVRDEAFEHLEKASARLIATRPTNTSLARMLETALAHLRESSDPDAPWYRVLLDWIEGQRDRYYQRAEAMGRYGAGLIRDGEGILTMCFAETSFILSLSLAWKQGKGIRVWVPETRPYLQGARLTAPCIHELGIPVQIITDGMPAYLMSRGKIHKYFTAADLVTLDGHVVNKIGTFPNALAAHHHGIPYFVFSMSPDRGRPDRASIVVEERGPEEIRSFCGVPTTLDEIDAYYPAFDITPPRFVAGIITEYGVLSPYDLKRYFGGSQ